MLLALNAADGRPVATFGEEGTLGRHADGGGTHRLSLRDGARASCSRTKLILGFTTTENADSFPGSVRAFSAVDGSLVWQFDTIPKTRRPGFGDLGTGCTRKGGRRQCLDRHGAGRGARDPVRPHRILDAGFLRCEPVGGTTCSRTSLVAIDARTGERIWHYQVIRHDLWDRDNPSPPTLVRLERGRPQHRCRGAHHEVGAPLCLRPGDRRIDVSRRVRVDVAQHAARRDACAPAAGFHRHHQPPTVRDHQSQRGSCGERARENQGLGTCASGRRRGWARCSSTPGTTGVPSGGGSALRSGHQPADRQFQRCRRHPESHRDSGGIQCFRQLRDALRQVATEWNSRAPKTGPDLNGILERMSYREVGEVIEKGTAGACPASPICRTWNANACAATS